MDQALKLVVSQVGGAGAVLVRYVDGGISQRTVSEDFHDNWSPWKWTPYVMALKIRYQD